MSAERKNRIRIVRDYVAAVECELNTMKIRPRSFYRYPFDLTGLSLVSKAFGLARSAFILLDAGMDDEAFTLMRSLVECALTLRFLTQDKTHKVFYKRIYDYTRFAVADKQFWMYWALQNNKGNAVEAEILERARRWDIIDDPKPARKHWSCKDGFAWKVNLEPHPLDGDKYSDLAKKSVYAIDYHHTSSYVHVYATCIDNYVPQEIVPYEVINGSHAVRSLYQQTIFMILRYVHASTSYAIFGMNLDRPQILNDLFSEVVERTATWQT